MKRSLACVRRFAWAATAILPVIVVLWIASGHFNLNWKTTRGQHIMIASGRLLVRDIDRFVTPQLGWTFWYGYEPWSNLYRIAVWDEPRPEYLVIVLWPIPLAGLIGTCWLWRRSFVLTRAMRTDTCLKCNYDRAGLDPAAACPECGKVPAQE